MSKSLVLMIGFVVGLTLFLSNCGGDDVEDLPSIDIPLAFLSPMAAGEYTVKITITAADISNQIVDEHNLAIVEGSNQTYEVTVNDVPVGNQREVKVEVFKTGNRLYVGSGTVYISSDENRLAMRLEKIAELLSSEPKAGAQMLSSELLTLNFSAPPGIVTVNGTQAVVQGHTALWTAYGLAGGATLNIAWTAAGGGNDTLQLIIIGSPAIINITPASATLTALGDTIQLRATVKDGKNQPISNAIVSWSSSNPSVASVSTDGLVTALGNGTATIRATSGGASNSVVITVAQRSAAINITPASATLTALGDTIQLSATVKDGKNQPISNAIVSWSSSNSVVVSVSPRGLVTARGNGEVTITATSGAKSLTAVITVEQLTTTIEITPAVPPPIVVGQTLQLSATSADPNNNLIAGAGVNWATSNPSVADINPTGLVIARSNGRTTIIASSGGLSHTVTITVPDTTGPSVVSGTVSHGDIKIDIGPINAGGFRFDFDEPIIGSIKLTDEAGVNLNWIANVLGQTATLTVVPGKELVDGKTYKIEIDVKDGADNKTKQTITFVTDKP